MQTLQRSIKFLYPILPHPAGVKVGHVTTIFIHFRTTMHCQKKRTHATYQPSGSQEIGLSLSCWTVCGGVVVAPRLLFSDAKNSHRSGWHHLFGSWISWSSFRGHTLHFHDNLQIGRCMAPNIPGPSAALDLHVLKVQATYSFCRESSMYHPEGTEIAWAGPFRGVSEKYTLGKTMFLDKQRSCPLSLSID